MLMGAFLIAMVLQTGIIVGAGVVALDDSGVAIQEEFDVNEWDS